MHTLRQGRAGRTANHEQSQQRSWTALRRVAMASLLAIASSLVLDAPAHAEADVSVGFTQIGIYPRSGPSMSAERVGAALADGTPVTVVCEVEAEPVSNGYGTIRIWDQLSDGTWLPNAFLATGTDSWTPGVPRCDDGGDISSAVNDASEAAYGDPCMAAYPGGTVWSEGIFGGTRTRYDAEESLYQVCMGFGAPVTVDYSPGMKCAVIAAAANAWGAPTVGTQTSLACDVASIGMEGADALPGLLCGVVGESFASASGVAAAGTTAATGPGAAAVGVTVYKQLAALSEITCGALFDGGAYDFGVQWEADHETRVASDIVNDGKCLRLDERFGQLSWAAADC